MNRCRDCQHYRVDSDSEDADCALATSTSGEADHPESLAVAQDYESYQAFLRISADYGCVQWVGK